MTATISADELQRFRQMVAGRTGLAFPESQGHRLAEVLERRVQATAGSCDSYLQLLDSALGGPLEWERLADELTVGETFFFRNAAQFQAFAELAVPEALRRHGGMGTLQVLSAGCSSGEEPYSLVMTLQDLGATLGGLPWAVTAIDLNAQALERARLGVYTSWSLRETSKLQRERHFLNLGANVLVAPESRSHLTFEQRNLVVEDAGFWSPGRFDVIFCRNVLMYLVPAIAAEVVRRFARCLAPGGYLFMGHAETLRGLSVEFETCSSHGTFYYRRPDPERVRTPLDARASADPTTILALPAPELPQASQAWISAINQSAQRVATLAGSASRPPSGELLVGPGSAPSATSYVAVIDALQHERYAAAAGQLAAAEPPRLEPLHTILAGLAQLHLGEEAQAESAARRQLSASPTDARLHYLLGLCREQLGDTAQAMTLYRSAAACDGPFALAHLRLGMLLRRDARPQEARAELLQAEALIPHEDDLHLALFGGGFSREAIADLCRRLVQGRS